MGDSIMGDWFATSMKIRKRDPQFSPILREGSGFQVQVALQYNDSYSDNILSFVNNIRTKDGVLWDGAQDRYHQGYNDLKDRSAKERISGRFELPRSICKSWIPEEHLQFEGQTRMGS